MAVDIKFDIVGNPEPPTIILATRNGKKLGQLNVNADSIELVDKLNDASEFSFTLNKYIDGVITNLWDKVVDFKLIYCKEWDMWFEATVELDEETETVKTVFCKQLGQAELSQIMLYNVEINTEGDIARDDYKITILYDETDTESSLLHRLLEKAPHYSIAHVDASIAGLQRSFSFDDTSIYDAFQEIAEEIGCLFMFPSNSDDDGNIQRTIYVYDLQQNCLNNECLHRGEFTDECPKCNGHNILEGYGNDTLIFVTSDELASSGIQLTSDVDSVKNCFKLEAGDDLMTATIRNCNPNGTDYIWRFSSDMKADMSDELVAGIDSYNDKYQELYNKDIDVDATLLKKYNNLVAKYKDVYNTDSSFCINCGHKGDFVDSCPECGSSDISVGDRLQEMVSPITGYPELMNAYYNTIDLSLYLESGMMPNVELDKMTAQDQIGWLNAFSLSPVAVTNKKIASLATVNSAVLSMAKIIIRPTHKVQINTSELSENKNIWRGNFTIISYSDENDTAIGDIVEIEVTDDVEEFAKQKIEKALNKENTDDYSVTALFKMDYEDFCEEIKRYALNPLSSFYEACQSCIDILIGQGVGEDTESDLYKNLYEPYYKKASALETEIELRQKEIYTVLGIYDADGDLVSEGMQSYLIECRNEIQKELDFANHLGIDLWNEFCSFRREDKYLNDNYISDGLNNAELFKKALEFYEVAENEIYKSSEAQYSISAKLNNLLAIPKFKDLVKSFKVGNWIRVQIDDKIYKLRLIEYGIDYNDFNNISVEFSDVTKVKNGLTDVEDILSQASSMASSYGSIQRQAKQGDNAKNEINRWLANGLNTALVQIQSNDSEEIIITKNGLIGRSYNELNDTYSPEQFKLTHNIMAYTTDNWQTVSSALGKHDYRRWNGKTFEDATDYGLSTKFVTAGYVTGSQIIGGEIVSSNYRAGESGTYINLIDGDFDFAGGKIVYKTNDNTVTLNGVTIEWSNTNKPDVQLKDITGLEEYLDRLDDIEEQIDGKAETWYQSEPPDETENWDATEENSKHLGDLWFDVDENKNYIYSYSDGEYYWAEIDNIPQDIYDKIDKKSQIFTSEPTTPYYEGDLWVQGSDGDILYCTTDKMSGDFDSNHWVKSSKYTDDSALNKFISEEYADDLKGINNQIDGKARSWYQETDPSEDWDENEDHEGDLWYNPSSDSHNTYIYKDGAWQATSVPQELFDKIDGIASIYVTMPDNPVDGDLLIPTSDITMQDGTVYKSGKVYKYDGDSWIEISYTDDTRANEAYELGHKIETGLGFTEITGDYVISPNIIGGKLLIGDKTGATYAEISRDGKLTCTGADIKGKISATEGDIGGWYLDEYRLYSGKGSTYVALDSGSANTNYAFWAGGEDCSTANFRVSRNGDVHINGNLTLTSGNITWTDGTPWSDSGLTQSDVTTLITSTLVSSPTIIGGKYYATGQARNWWDNSTEVSAYYICNENTDNIVASLSYDVLENSVVNQYGEVIQNKKRVFLKTNDETALKLESGYGISIEAPFVYIKPEYTVLDENDEEIIKDGRIVLNGIVDMSNASQVIFPNNTTVTAVFA